MEKMLDHTNEVVVEETEKNQPVEEKTTEEQKVKNYTSEEVEEIVKKRLKRFKDKLDRNYNNSLSKYKEIAYLNAQGIEANSDDIDDVLNKTREYYNPQGFMYEPKQNESDINILASADAKKIIEISSDDELEQEIDSLLKNKNVSLREEKTISYLVEELKTRQKKQELEKIGVSSDIYNSKDFINFENSFTKGTPIKDIYELYSLKNMPKKEVNNIGDIKNKEENNVIKGFYSYDEAMSFTEKDFNNNPDLYNAVLNSMSKW